MTTQSMTVLGKEVGFVYFLVFMGLMVLVTLNVIIALLMDSVCFFLVYLVWM